MGGNAVLPAASVRLDGLFGPGILAETTPLPAAGLDIRDEDRVQVEGAVESRRNEFLAGRGLARRLLSRVGIEAGPLLRGADRAPVWPPGATGSIAHTADLCAAAVARKGAVRSVGIDVEPDEPIEPELWSSLCTPTEREWVGRRPFAEQGRWVRMIFCAKEAVFKCRYPMTGRMIDFRDLELRIDGETGEIFLPRGDGAEASVRGRVLVRERWIFAGAEAFGRPR